MDFITYPFSEHIYTARSGELNKNHCCFKSGQVHYEQLTWGNKKPAKSFNHQTSHYPHFHLGWLPASCYLLLVFSDCVFLPLGKSTKDLRAIIGVFFVRNGEVNYCVWNWLWEYLFWVDCMRLFLSASLPWLDNVILLACHSQMC